MDYVIRLELFLLNRHLQSLAPGNLLYVPASMPLCPFVSSLVLSVDEDIDNHLSKGQRLNLYRILLEASNNVLKHANADHFFVEIGLVSSNHLRAIIEDDGSGFNPRRHHRANSLGLANIQTRARLIHADVEWLTPTSGKGTRFELNMGIQS
jgi:signal transduction histidine kinase